MQHWKHSRKTDSKAHRHVISRSALASNHPLITYHFKNKEELWRASADRIFTQFNMALREAREASADHVPAHANGVDDSSLRAVQRHPAGIAQGHRAGSEPPEQPARTGWSRNICDH